MRADSEPHTTHKQARFAYAILSLSLFHSPLHFLATRTTTKTTTSTRSHKHTEGKFVVVGNSAAVATFLPPFRTQDDTLIWTLRASTRFNSPPPSDISSSVFSYPTKHLQMFRVVSYLQMTNKSIFQNHCICGERERERENEIMNSGNDWRQT